MKVMHDIDCEKLQLLLHLVIFDLAALETEPWRSHLQECAICRSAWEKSEKSLAVYQQLEWQRIDGLNEDAHWEDFSRKLSAQAKKPGLKGIFRSALVAGLAGVVLVAGIVGWNQWEDGRTAVSQRKGGQPVTTQDSRADLGSEEQTIPPATRFVTKSREAIRPDVPLTPAAERLLPRAPKSRVLVNGFGRGLRDFSPPRSIITPSVLLSGRDGRAIPFPVRNGYDFPAIGNQKVTPTRYSPTPLR